MEAYLFWDWRKTQSVKPTLKDSSLQVFSVPRNTPKLNTHGRLHQLGLRQHFLIHLQRQPSQSSLNPSSSWTCREVHTIWDNQRGKLTLKDNSKFSPPQMSMPGSYVPRCSKYSRLMANSPPAMVGDLKAAIRNLISEAGSFILLITHGYKSA